MKYIFLGYVLLLIFFFCISLFLWPFEPFKSDAIEIATKIVQEQEQSGGLSDDDNKQAEKEPLVRENHLVM